MAVSEIFSGLANAFKGLGAWQEEQRRQEEIMARLALIRAQIAASQALTRQREAYTKIQGSEEERAAERAKLAKIQAMAQLAPTVAGIHGEITSEIPYDPNFEGPINEPDPGTITFGPEELMNPEALRSPAVLAALAKAKRLKTQEAETQQEAERAAVAKSRELSQGIASERLSALQRENRDYEANQAAQKRERQKAMLTKVYNSWLDRMMSAYSAGESMDNPAEMSSRDLLTRFKDYIDTMPWLKSDGLDLGGPLETLLEAGQTEATQQETPPEQPEPQAAVQPEPPGEDLGTRVLRLIQTNVPVSEWQDEEVQYASTHPELWRH